MNFLRFFSRLTRPDHTYLRVRLRLNGLRNHFGDGESLRAREHVRTSATWLGRTWEPRASLVGFERL